MTRTERGWAGHFICAHSCLFRRNTLLQEGDVRIVVSTVGNMRTTRSKQAETIGVDRYYETMAFHAKMIRGYWEADVSEQISFRSPWTIDTLDHHTDQVANDMHEAVVKEIMENMEKEFYSKGI